MPFIKFAESARSFKTRASVRRSGTIGLSSACIEKFELRGTEYAILHYDADTKRIGIRPIDVAEQGAHPIKLGKTGAAISARRFFDYFGIPLEKTKRYDATWDDEEKMIVVQL